MYGLVQALIAAVAAFLAIFVPCAVLAFLCGRSKKRRRKEWHPPPLSSVTVSEPSSMSVYDPSLARLSLADLAAATGGFSPDAIIGDGSFGFVYRAVLPGGGAVAVKRLSSDHASGEGNREFRAEVEVLGGLHHPNLARLLGFCAAGRDRLLIYELLERGSLDAWLHGDAPAEQLPWAARLRVARGAAGALTFLHHGCQPPVLHRDIKASNVLLDDGFEAKLADFGLARIVRGSPAASHVSTQAAGTAGYMAPEIRAGKMASAKADVYSFGVLMVEMVTGRRPSWPVKDAGGKEVELVQWTRGKVEAGLASEVVDGRMGAGEKATEEMEEVKGFLDISCRCTEEIPKNRPAMEEVVELLNKL